jgi:hypothetical protein
VLALLVAWILLADDAQPPPAAHKLALGTHALERRSNLHLARMGPQLMAKMAA